MSFELLSEPIRRFVREAGWEELRPIQVAAIAKIINSSDDVILASRTASGKTEAAFLPILSITNFEEPGVQVLYISPLIALINDQFPRIEALCERLDVTVTKWHGESSRTLKNNLLDEPSGIVLITPESIQAMFVNKPYDLKRLFSNLKFVIIDEIHSFVGHDRGIQLQSLLFELNRINSGLFRIIGLSATIGDYSLAKLLTGRPEKTKVLLDKSSNEISAEFKYFETEGDELSLDLLKDLFKNVCDCKSLVFPNSRGRTEEVAVNLKKIADKTKVQCTFFSHHSSVDKEVREYVEFFAKNEERENFCISCTSTLELGIDIGGIDKVVQIDSSDSVASLIQRVGRSGRRKGETSKLLLYASDKWNLIHAIACWELFKEGFIEPPAYCEKPYDILLHQILTLVKSFSAIDYDIVIDYMKHNYAFEKIEEYEIAEIIEHLIQKELLEKLRNELIIGVWADNIVKSREFYSVFKYQENLKVVSSGLKIGEVAYTQQIELGANIYLAAKIWKILNVDLVAGKVEVKPAPDGKRPKFIGDPPVVHHKVREKVWEILLQDNKYLELDFAGRDTIFFMRHIFSKLQISDYKTQRPVVRVNLGKNNEFFTFAGTKINRTLDLLFKGLDLQTDYDESSSSFTFSESAWPGFSITNLLRELNSIDYHVENLLDASYKILDFSKWSRYLPKKYQIEIIKSKYLDITGTYNFLNNLKIVELVEDEE